MYCTLQFHTYYLSWWTCGKSLSQWCSGIHFLLIFQVLFPSSTFKPAYRHFLWIFIVINVPTILWYIDIKSLATIDIIVYPTIFMYITLSFIMCLSPIFAIFAKSYRQLMNGLIFSIIIGSLTGLMFALWLIEDSNYEPIMYPYMISYVVIVSMVEILYIFLLSRIGFKAVYNINEDYDPMYIQTMNMLSMYYFDLIAASCYGIIGVCGISVSIIEKYFVGL